MADKDMLDGEVQNLRALYDKVWNLLFALLGAIGIVFMTAYTSKELKSLYVADVLLMLLALSVTLWLFKIWNDLSKKTKELRDV